MPAQVQLDSRAIADLLRGPQGPTARYLSLLAERVQVAAKRRVGYDANKPPGEQGGAHLRDTIVKRITVSLGGVEVLVGSEHPIAYLHHEGTEPHEIRARNASVLHFTLPDGTEVFVRSVHHPGTRPNRYLTDAMKEVVTH